MLETIVAACGRGRRRHLLRSKHFQQLLLALVNSESKYFMLRLAPVMLVFASICHGETSHTSFCFGEIYESTVSDERLQKTPKWDESADGPPVTARSAIKLANVVRDDLVKNDELVKESVSFEWKIVSATIRFADEPGRCYWEITYEARIDRRGVTSGPDPRLCVFVLMDGTALRPIRASRRIFPARAK
jgi:hypothetical protein